MRDESHGALLPREQVAEGVKAVFAPQVDLLEEMVNYGSNLIPRCFEPASERRIHDAVKMHVEERQLRLKRGL